MIRSFLFSLVAFISLAVLPASSHAVVVWDFVAGGGTFTGWVEFDDTHPSFVGGGLVTSDDAVIDSYMTDGSSVWTFTENLSGDPRFLLGPNPAIPLDSFLAGWESHDLSPPTPTDDTLLAGGWQGSIAVESDVTSVFDGSFSLRPIAPAVPEPASIAIWSILGICLAGYGYRRRRQR